MRSGRPAVSLPDFGQGLASSEGDAKRFHACLAVHYLALGKDELMSGRHHWVAISLGLVSSDNTVYPSMAEAVRDQHGDANTYAYFRLPPVCPSVRECASLLGYFRRRYDAGWRPDGVHEGAELILPTRLEALN